MSLSTKLTDIVNTSLIIRRAVQAFLPATLLLAACSKSDVPAPAPAVDQGQVVFINAASHIAPTTLKFLVDNTQKASQDYGTSSGYQAIPTGSRAVQVTAGTQTALNQTITVEKNKNYTFVATPVASTSAVGGLLFADDLTAPAATKARIRVINLGQSLATPIRLAQATAVAGAGVIVSDVAANAASAFTEFIPGSYSLFISDNMNNSLVVVGDGTGTGAGTKNYEAGKLYTVVVSGTAGSLNQNQQLKAFLSQNN